MQAFPGEVKYLCLGTGELAPTMAIYINLNLAPISLHTPPWKSSLQIASSLTYFCLLSCRFQLSWLEPFRTGFLPAKCQTFLPHSSEASSKPKVPKCVPLNWGGEGGTGCGAGGRPAHRRSLVLGVRSVKRVGLAERRDVCEAWRTHLGECSLLFTGREWLCKETWKPEQHTWQQFIQ